MIYIRRRSDMNMEWVDRTQSPQVKRLYLLIYVIFAVLTVKSEYLEVDTPWSDDALQFMGDYCRLPRRHTNHQPPSGSDGILYFDMPSMLFDVSSLQW
jgi:hypothetical protein